MAINLYRRRDIERQRQDQILIEKQWKAKQVQSSVCKKKRHWRCFAVNCTCKCHMEA